MLKVEIIHLVFQIQRQIDPSSIHPNLMLYSTKLNSTVSPQQTDLILIVSATCLLAIIYIHPVLLLPWYFIFISSNKLRMSSLEPSVSTSSSLLLWQNPVKTAAVFTPSLLFLMALQNNSLLSGTT